MTATMIVVATCPRPGGVDYFENTISKLALAGAAGCAHRVVLSDGAAPAAPVDGWEVHVRYPAGGSRLALWGAFERAHAARVDRLIYCEDDVTPCRNAVARMQTVPIPDVVAFMTFHDQRGQTPPEPGIYLLPLVRGYDGSCCLVFPRRAIEWLVQQDPLRPLAVHQRGGLLFAADLALAYLALRSPWPNYAVHLPRLVRHDGAVSAAHPTKELIGSRATIDFPGEDFDAMAL